MYIVRGYLDMNFTFEGVYFLCLFVFYYLSVTTTDQTSLADIETSFTISSNPVAMDMDSFVGHCRLSVVNASTYWVGKSCKLWCQNFQLHTRIQSKRLNMDRPLYARKTQNENSFISEYVHIHLLWHTYTYQSIIHTYIYVYFRCSLSLSLCLSPALFALQFIIVYLLCSLLYQLSTRCLVRAVFNFFKLSFCLVIL